jgi:hypothetical protein
MTIKTIFSAMALWSLLFSSVWATDLNGKWIGRLDDKGKPREISFDFEVADAKLTGTVAGALNGSITNGKVNGNELSFSLSVGMDSAKRTIIFKGQMANGEIKFTATREGGEGRSLEFTVKRAAK